MKPLILFLLLSISYSVFSQENANEGKRFLITFPQNTSLYSSRDYKYMGLTIESKTGAKVKVSFPHTSNIMQFTLDANDSYTMDCTQFFGNLLQVEDISDGIISDKVFEITSDDYISVSIISSKGYSSDGYLAYPVSEWGNNYIHNSLYHFTGSSQSGYRVLSSGCTIIAQADNTNIKILLKGRGIGTTESGNFKIGDTINVTLNEGRAYTFKTRALKSNNFDLSGSLITSDKPIGVISFHERTLIPQVSPKEGMNFLVEMMQPLSNWKKKYVSIDFGRDFGDFFRVLPLKDNTHLTIKNYNEQGKLISTKQETINTGGGFYEYNNAYIDNYNMNELEGIKGITIWEADAPILVTQYSYSEDWEKTSLLDDEDNFDPFMLNLINEDQFTTNISFAVPELKLGRFTDHKINLIVKVNPLLDIDNQLKSLKFDGKPIYLDYPILLTNKIDGTNYYWLRMDISKGQHTLTSNVRFAAFHYGFGKTDAYGMQTALGKLPLEDTLFLNNYEYDCSSINSTYSIKSKFGLDENDGLESKSFKIINAKIDYSYNVDLNYKISKDSTELNIWGNKLNNFLPSIVYFQVLSETGKTFYDSLTFSNKENSITLNKAGYFNSKPNEIREYNVSINEIKDTLAFLTDFSLVIKYKSDWFHLEDIEIDGDSYLDNVHNEYIADTTYSILNVPISRDELTGGNFVSIYLLTLLSKDTLYTPEITLNSRFDNHCYSGIVVDTLHTLVCFQNLRLVTLDTEEPLSLISNSIIANKDLTFSIIDYTGRTVINQRLGEGAKIDLSEYGLPIGAYWIFIKNYPNLPPLKYFNF